MTAEEIRRYEEITLNSSSALKQMVYDGWVLRMSPGSKVKRSNSVTPLYPSTLPLEHKLAYCARLYAAEGLPPRFRVNDFSEAGLDARLAALGYGVVEPTLFMTLPLTMDAPLPFVADCHEPPLAVWLAINRDLRGEAKETLAAQQARLESLALPCFAVALNFGEETVCVGLGIMEQDHFGVFSVFTPPGQCGRGYGTRVTRALLAIGQRENARVAFLQVDEANAAALHLYTALGFRPAYRYWYRVKAD